MSESPPDPAPNVSWFDAEDAPGKVDLRTCIHCGLCLTACPTYRTLRIEPDSPRGRLYLMRGLSEGRVAADDELVRHLDQCLDCRACETVCPAGVPYSKLLEQTRGQLARRRPSRSPL
jgi:glycolate oxidase iron-sulfur subunit